MAGIANEQSVQRAGEDYSKSGGSKLSRPSEQYRPPTLPLPQGGRNPICVSGVGYVQVPPHWRKAAEAMQCSHFEEVRRMIEQFNHSQKVVLQGTNLTVAQVAALTRRPEVKVELDEGAAKSRVDESSNWVLHNIAKGTDTYGVTTGFGATSHRRTDQAVDLQKELIRFLNAGVLGKKDSQCLPSEYAKAAMAVRTNTLMQGYSGIRWDILRSLQKLMDCNITQEV